MSHCPYLLVINYLLDCMPHLFEFLTALLEYLLLQGAPCPSGCYTYMIIDWIYTIYSSSTALLLLVNSCMLHQNNRNTCPTCVFSSEKKTLCSTRYAAVQINYCLKRTFAIKVATTDDFHNKWKLSCAYKIDTFHGEQRWMGSKGGPW